MARENARITIHLPIDVREWIEKQSAARRMTMSDYCVRLMTRGIQVEAIDETVARLTAVVESAESARISREVLRQALATRYIVETQTKALGIKIPITLGSDANIYADRELGKIFPKGIDQ